MNKITLQKIAVEGNTVKYNFAVNQEMSRFFKTDAMFLRYDCEMSRVPLSILTIPFVNCMAGLSWFAGAAICVDEIDETYYNAFKQLKVAYSELHDAELNGILIPSIIEKNEILKSSKHLLLFGGGVDCHTSFQRNKDKISGVINIYGWAGDEKSVSDVDVSDKEQTESFAHQFNLEAYHVTSNFASLFNLNKIDKEFCYHVGTTYWYGFLHSMAFLSISIPLAWVKGYSNLMIASSFNKEKLDLHCGSFITTDTETKFASNGITLHDGFDLNRQEKVAVLAEFQKSTGKPYKIQACSFNDHNCCRCEKCFRTIVELIAENADPRQFGFNIEGSMTSHWKSVIEKEIAFLAVKKENYYYHEHTKKRMRENYRNIEDKEFVDWFLSFDFNKAKRDGLRRYYRQNFFSILKRKLKL